MQKPIEIKILAILFILSGIVFIVRVFFLGLLQNIEDALFEILISKIPFPRIVDIIVNSALYVCIMVFMVIGILDFIIGYGLLKMQRWAFSSSIFVGITNLLNFPFGTIIGICILLTIIYVYVFRGEVRRSLI